MPLCYWSSQLFDLRAPSSTNVPVLLLGSLSSDVFERRTSSGSEPFPLLISLDATVFILPSVLILTETICPKICSKSRLKSAKRPFPVDVRRSKTSLLKLPSTLNQPDYATPHNSLETWEVGCPSDSLILRTRYISCNHYFHIDHNAPSFPPHNFA